jgi:zinc protease
MMNEGTANYSAEAFNDELKKLGSNISVNAGMEGLTLSVSSLIKNLDATLKLLEERMFRPAFEEADFLRLKKQQIEGIKNNSTQPGSIATSVYNKLLFGEDNIRAVSVSGTEQTVENISLDDVKEFYQSYFSPSVAELVVVGQIDRKDILAKLEFLKKWQGPKVQVPAFAATKAPSNTKIYLVDVPKSAQSEIRIGYPTAMMFDATGEYYKTGLMNYNLGGAFNSRINLNLREDKGWTYGARSSFSGSKLPGVFTASAGVKLTATDSAVFEFIREIKEFADAGISDKELAFLKSSIGQSDARKYETLFQKAGFLNQIITYNLDKDFTVKQSNILKNMKKEELNALAKKHLKTNNMYIVVVGDAAQVKPGLERLGYEIVEVDKEGNLLSRAE